jgi:hypothetical protein
LLKQHLLPHGHGAGSRLCIVQQVGRQLQRSRAAALADWVLPSCTHNASLVQPCSSSYTTAQLQPNHLLPAAALVALALCQDRQGTALQIRSAMLLKPRRPAIEHGRHSPRSGRARQTLNPRPQPRTPPVTPFCRCGSSTTAMLWSPAAAARRMGWPEGSPGMRLGASTTACAARPSASCPSSLLPQPHSSSPCPRKRLCCAPALTCTDREN